MAAPLSQTARHLVARLDEAAGKELAEGAETHDADSQLLGLGQARLRLVLKVERHGGIKRSDVHCA